MAVGLDALGVGIVAPVVPGLVQQLAHLSPEKAAPWVGALIASYAAMQFLLAPLLGALSDRFGRRPVILASVLGIGIDYVLLALAPSLWWLFLGRLVAGATSANVAAATAYIADVSAQEDRARRFGLIGATFGAGFVIGPAFGGLLGEHGLRLAFYAAAVLAFANGLYGFFVLPESLRPENRRALSWRRASLFGLLGAAWKVPRLRILTFAWSCSWVGLGAVQSSLVLFTRYSFGWDAAAGGLAIPSIRALVTKTGGADRQGEMEGTLTAVEGLTAMTAPMATASLFFLFTSSFLPVRFAGAPFLLAAGMAMIAGVLLRRR